MKRATQAVTLLAGAALAAFFLLVRSVFLLVHLDDAKRCADSSCPQSPTTALDVAAVVVLLMALACFLTLIVRTSRKESPPLGRLHAGAAALAAILAAAVTALSFGWID